MYWLQRTQILIGTQGIDILSRSRVAVFGLGGVGSFAVEALVRAGIGHLRLVDPDTVHETNLNRQLQATRSVIGELKTVTLAKRARDINPQVDLQLIAESYGPGNSEELLDPPIDFVIDAIDSPGAKVDLLARCVERGWRVVSSMGAASRIDPASVHCGDLFSSCRCPLAKMVRKRLRRRGIRQGIQAVYSDEAPVLAGRTAGTGDPESAADMDGTTAPHGTLSYMPAIFGLVCAGHVIQTLLADLPLPRRGQSFSTTDR